MALKFNDSGNYFTKFMSSPKVSGPPGSASPVSISQLLPAQLNQLREQLEKVFSASHFRKWIYFKPRMIV